MTDKRVLVLDIETSPIQAYVWGLRDQNISLSQIKADWYVLAWAAKWLGEPASAVIYMDQRRAKHIEDDRKILLPLWKLLDQADIVITQNGARFDAPKLNARFITHGMNPPSPYKHLDTYQIVRRVAAFTSNKLEYLTDKLCTKYKKIKHGKFPGMSLWKECLAGNLAAWNEMKKYNIRDVLATEEFYNIIKAWTPSSMPAVFEPTKSPHRCRTCGDGRIQRRGYDVNKTAKYVRLQCQNCGTWQRGAKVNER